MDKLAPKDLRQALLDLRDSSPDQYASIISELPGTNTNVFQRLVEYLKANNKAACQSFITELRDDDLGTFYELIRKLQATDARVFRSLLNHLQEMATQALQELVAGLGIKKIVCVDDEYARTDIEYVIGLIETSELTRNASVQYFEGIPIEAGRDVYGIELRRRWQETDDATKASVCSNIRREIGAAIVPGEISENGRDARDAGFLALLLRNVDFLPLSFTQWKEQREALIGEADSQNTLFLFDQDLRHDGGGPQQGIELLKALLESASNTILCGLLTHTVTPENEYEEWKNTALENMVVSLFQLRSLC